LGRHATRAALAGRLHSTAIHLLRRVRVVDGESGLSAARLSALSVLVFGGSRPVGELAAAEQVTAATMSRLVSALEAEGLVARTGDADDARRVVVSATPAGVRTLENARARRVASLTEVLERIPPDEEARVAEAVGILERVLAATSSSAPGR
jgi:DNA-binding MarR family transcriptional regulator